MIQLGNLTKNIHNWRCQTAYKFCEFFFFFKKKEEEKVLYRYAIIKWLIIACFGNNRAMVLCEKQKIRLLPLDCVINNTIEHRVLSLLQMQIPINNNIDYFWIYGILFILLLFLFFFFLSHVSLLISLKIVLKWWPILLWCWCK